MRYSRTTGRSVERIQGLADGVFAVAMTLLVLDLRLPAEAITSDDQLWEHIARLGPQFGAYALSFTMLGTFWLAVHGFLGRLNGSNRHLSWSVLAFLFFVTTLPFVASVLADHANLRLAVVLYWLNLLLLGVCLGWGLECAHHAGFVGDIQAFRLTRRRLVLAQSLYAGGALLGVWNPSAGVIGLAAAQLYLMVSPGLPPVIRGPALGTPHQ